LTSWHIRMIMVYRYEMHSAPKEMRYRSTPRRLKQFVGAPFVRKSFRIEVPSLNSGVLSTRLSECIYLRYGVLYNLDNMTSPLLTDC
jgi:hypothetical protein